MQRHATLAVGLLAAHLRAAEASRALHADAEGAGLLDGLDRALHRAAERDAADELVADPLGDERGVELGLLDLLDVERDAVRLAGDLLDVLLQAVGLRAAAADDDARARGVDVDARAVARALDLDPADRSALELGVQVVADLPVLDDVVAVGALVEPARLPVRGDPESEPVGVDLLAHQSVCSSLAAVASSSGASGASSVGRLGLVGRLGARLGRLGVGHVGRGRRRRRRRLGLERRGGRGLLGGGLLGGDGRLLAGDLAAVRVGLLVRAAARARDAARARRGVGRCASRGRARAGPRPSSRR